MHELREMLCEELDKITKQGELSAGSLDIIDKLTHSIKSIDTIIAMEEAGYSNDMYYDDSSYRNVNRDARGRYSRMNKGYSRTSKMEGLKAELRDMLESASSEDERMMIRKWIKQVEA